MKNFKIKLAAFIGLAFIALSANAQLDRSKMPEPGPEPTINLEKPTEFQLKNGINVMVVENNKLPRVSYQLSIDNKPFKEGDKAGVASILSSILGNGTTSISKKDFPGTTKKIVDKLQELWNKLLYKLMFKNYK